VAEGETSTILEGYAPATRNAVQAAPKIPRPVNGTRREKRRGCTPICCATAATPPTSRRPEPAGFDPVRYFIA
jgi:hypothetical protein